MPVSAAKIYLGDTLVASAGSDATDWTRPAEWPELAPVAATDQVFRGLHAVFDSEANFATIRCTGAYTVDWGDGSTPVNVASNTTAYYNYSYSASGLSSTSVASLGYKTATVTVTPQSGQTLSVIDISQKHNQSGLSNGSSSQWLDICLAMNNVGTFTANNSNWPARLIERFQWIGGSRFQTNFANFLIHSSRLQSINLFNTGAGTSFVGFLIGCSQLPSIPLYDLSLATNVRAFCEGNRRLKTLPPFDLKEAVTMENFAANCTGLLELPFYNTAKVTNLIGFAGGCPGLREIQGYNFSAVTNPANIFVGSVFISRIRATFSANVNISLANLSLGPAALNEIYTNLPTASGSPRTITVTGNWGTTSHTPSIATAKGWTVTA